MPRGSFAFHFEIFRNSKFCKTCKIRESRNETRITAREASKAPHQQRLIISFDLDRFILIYVSLESLVIEEDVSGIITTIKNDREEVRLTLNEIYTKYSSNLSRQLAKK